MNIELLKRLAKYIEQEPQGFNMRYFALASDAVPCGTQCCIGGTAVLLDNPRGYLRMLKFGNDEDVFEAAKKALRLTEVQAERLFYFKGWLYENSRVGWPEKFQTAYETSVTSAERAKVGTARIRHFIKTKGRE